MTMIIAVGIVKMHKTPERQQFPAIAVIPVATAK
jgi:hypothetical protein